MTEDCATKLNNGVSTSLFHENEEDQKQILPDNTSDSFTSSGETRDSNVTSDLDQAVAELEATNNNVLEHPVTSESTTTGLPSGCKSEQHQTVKQGVGSHEWTVPSEDSVPQDDDEQPTKRRDFSEIRAMFSHAGASQKMSSPRKATSLDLTPVKERTLNLDGMDGREKEPAEPSTNNIYNGEHNEGDSLVSRMKRNFEAANYSKENVGNTQRIKKPVSFEVDLDYCVTRDSSSSNVPHDPSRTQQIEKEMFKSRFNEHVHRTDPSNISLVDCPSIETLESNQQRIKEEEIQATTGRPSTSPKSFSFDISFDDEPNNKRTSPKTMEKPWKGKSIDSKTTMQCSSDNNSIKVVNEFEKTSEVQAELKDSRTDEKSYSFEVSFEDESPRKMTSRDKENKLIMKPSRTERPPGEKITATRGQHSPVIGPNQRTEYSKDDTSSINSFIDEQPTISSKNQIPSVSNKLMSFEVSFGDDTTAVSTSEPQKSTENNEKNERDEKNEIDEKKKKTHGISFDVCFDDDSAEKSKFNRKPKLTPKHIRLKTTKPTQQELENTKNKIRNDETTNQTATISTSFVAKSITPSVKQELNERNTYTLDDISNTLQSACEKGLTLEDALDDLAKHQETSEPTSSDMTLVAAVIDGVTPSKRGTYSLDEVATCLVAAADIGLTVSEALDTLANSEESGKDLTAARDYEDHLDYHNINKSTTVKNEDSSPNRGTYDLDEVSKKIDNEKDKGNSLEEALIQLLDEVQSVVKTTQKTNNRGTYDLKDVSNAVQDASDRGISVEETLEKITLSTDNNSKNLDSIQRFNTVDKKKTIPKEECSVLFGEGVPPTDSATGKRGTYSLDDLATQLESASVKGSSIVDTLSDISKPLPKQALPKVESTEVSKVEETGAARHFYTLDEVAQSLELAKSKGIHVVQALSNISAENPTEDLATPGSRGTYTLDKVAESLETAREKGLPVVMALENLVLHGGGSLKRPSDVAVHRRQGKLTNRKTYALASPLETIGEEKQLRLFDGTSRKLLPPMKDYMKGFQPQQYDDLENVSSSTQSNVVQTLDLLTSACEALLKTTGKNKDKTDKEQPSQPQSSSEDSRDIRQQLKTESRDSGISFPSGSSERGTYPLDEVSETLAGAAMKGIPVVEALGSLTVKESVTKYRIPRALRKASSKSESNINKNTTAKEESSRQTYSLDDVSSSVEAAKAKGIPVIAALDELTNSLAQFSATRTTPGKPLKKPDRPSIRKKEAARQDRSAVRSEFGREVQRSAGISFPISYPPAMRNSYSLDDVASAFEKAYQTGVPFQNVLAGMQPESSDTIQQTSEDAAITRSTGSLIIGKDDRQSTTTCEDNSRKVHSASSLTKVDEFSVSAITDSSSDGKIPSSLTRKGSTSSEGSLTCSSSYGSDVSINRDSSSTEELPHTSKVSSVRKQRRQSSGPFQLKKITRRNSPANLRKLNTSPLSSQGDSVESLTSRESEPSDISQKRGTYDLKKVGEQLDSFKVQGVPVVKGLDRLVSDMNSVGKPGNEKSKDIQVTPKRGTYSLEDISHHLDSGKTKGDSVIQALGTLSSNPDLSCISGAKDTGTMAPNTHEIEAIARQTQQPATQKDSQGASEPVIKRSQPSDSDILSDNSVAETDTRNTFNLDQVEVSIADATSRGVPVVEALDKLSHLEHHVNLDKTDKELECSKTNRKPKAQKPDQDTFFIEYLPSKTIVESPKFKVENGEAVQVAEEQPSIRKHDDLDNYPTRDVSAKSGNVSSEIDVMQVVDTISDQ
jgi:hypothetical protein